MKIFKDEPVLDSTGFFVYPPAPVELESTGDTSFTYNGVVLPPLPWEHTC